VPGSFLRLWLPVVLWAAVIFAFSSVPDLGTGLGGWDLVLRKLAHMAEYAILGALLVRATGRVGLAVALGTLYAVSDEVHQAFVPGRMGSPVDVAIDAVGVACGVFIWQSARRRGRFT
jgi:VanZ family protein